MCTPRKAKIHSCIIPLTVNYTLALENNLLNTPTDMVNQLNLTCLQLDQNILNNSCTLGASVQNMSSLNSSNIIILNMSNSSCSI